MTAAASILVVDDEADLRETVSDYLRLHGLDTRAADGGAAMRRMLAAAPVDLVVLDVRMPGEDGLSLARELRSTRDVGIVMATAVGDIVDRVVGLEVGADDYVAKPLDLRELLARVRAVLRRRGRCGAGRIDPAPPDSGGLGSAPRAGTLPTVRFGRHEFDPAASELRCPEGRAIRLTRSECDLLGAFARNPNRVLSRDELLGLVHGDEADSFDRSIDMRIARIRRKIEVDPARPAVIRTARGAGYIFACPGAADTGLLPD